MGAPATPTYPFAAPQATIANGAALSGAVYIGDGDLVAIQTPAVWTTAAMTFQGSYDGTNFFELYDASGNEIEIASADVVANRQIQMSVAGASMASPVTFIDFRGAVWVKVRSGTAAAPVNQGQATVLTLVVRKRRFGI